MGIELALDVRLKGRPNGMVAPRSRPLASYSGPSLEGAVYLLWPESALGSVDRPIVTAKFASCTGLALTGLGDNRQFFAHVDNCVALQDLEDHLVENIPLVTSSKNMRATIITRTW